MNYSSQNGSICSGYQSSSASAGQRPQSKAFKETEFFSIAARNWLIHQRYVRKEFDICKLLIDEELQKTNGYNEYANYILETVMSWYESQPEINPAQLLLLEHLKYLAVGKRGSQLKQSKISDFFIEFQGLILRHEGRIQDSLEYFKKCHLLNPKNIENIKQVARSLFLLGRHDLACEAYLEAKQPKESPDWNIYHHLGECFIQIGQMSKAKECLSQATHLGKSEASYRALARLSELEGDYKMAIDVYSTALEQHPGSCELAVDLGLLCLKRQDHARALLWLGYALAHDPKSTEALIAMGAMLQDHGEADNALAKYKIAAQHLPESAALWNNVGMCFFSKKKYIAAISCLRRANYLSPLDWLVQHNLGLLLLSCAQYASAFVALSACVKLNARHAPSFMLLAQTLMHLDDPGNAGKAYEQAVKLDGEDPAIRANYAAYFVKLGQHHRALEQLNAFNKLAQQVSNIDKQILVVVRSLTTKVTQDVFPQRHDIDDFEQLPQYQGTSNQIAQDYEETERVLASDEV